MNLYSVLAKQAPDKVFLSMLLGAFSGVAYALLIPLVMTAIQPAQDGLAMLPSEPFYVFGMEISNPPVALLFLSTLGLVWAGRTMSQVTLARVAVGMASELRTRMYDRICRATVASIERTGLPRIVNILTSDLPRVANGAQLAPSLLMDGVMLIGMLLYLFYLNTDVLWLVLKCIAFAVASTELVHLFSRRYILRAAQQNDALQGAVHSLVQGFKELKLSNEKRGAFLRDVLLTAEAQLEQANKTGFSLHSATANYGQVLSFLIIGVIVFIFVSYHAISVANLAGVVMTLLYIGSPLGSIMRIVPELKIARISLARVRELEAELPGEDIALAAAQAPAWRSVRFEGVVYQHQGSDGSPGFRIGPIDFELHKGQITFIVGGNGSGKSTLSKLLTLHYRPTEGSIHFDDVEITRDNLDMYRQDIFAIYSDYYLFDRLLTAAPAQARVDHYLEALGLSSKVQYRDGRFSTRALSDGQRRRLALVVAFVEDKDLYLFDEWAADQDPSFKNVFYREILPALRARGKAVVAITHDDRYFDVADKLLVMDQGRLSTSGRVEQQPRLARFT
jgi:putative ATP-binding cassette transporter